MVNDQMVNDQMVNDTMVNEKTTFSGRFFLPSLRYSALYGLLRDYVKAILRQYRS
ncbi:MAG: hypothetical protein IKO26_02535 [Paludibacteraceae bacterium]|nr:hypothetical protein [Paludibacteraceae bacterium]